MVAPSFTRSVSTKSTDVKDLTDVPLTPPPPAYIRSVSKISSAARPPINFIRSLSNISTVTDVIISLPKDEECDVIDESKGECELKTDWASLWIANLMTFFTALSFTIYFPTLVPFLLDMRAQITSSSDSDSDCDAKKSLEAFPGYVIGAYGLGQFLASPAFSYWNKKTNKIKRAVIVGFTLVFITNLIYCFLESFPYESRKWIMLVTRFGSGLGAGIVTLIKAYCATSCAPKDKGRSVAIGTAAYSLAVVLGPGVQTAFKGIGYPTNLNAGIFRLNYYTAPAYFTTICTLVMLIVWIFLFKEQYAGIAKDTAANNNPFFALPKFDPIAAATCIITWGLRMYFVANIEILESTYMIDMYNMNPTDGANVASLMSTGAGVIAFLTYMAFAWKLSRLIDERKGVIVGLCSVILFNLVTYPWSFYTATVTNPADLINMTGNLTTNLTSCGQVGWAADTKQVPQALFIAAFIILFGIGMPTMSVSCATLFAKIIGPRRQGTMQGFFVQSQCLTRIVGPIVVMQLFAESGPKPTWIMHIVVLGVILVPWVLYYKRMVPLDAEPKLEPGQHYNYKNGKLYRF